MSRLPRVTRDSLAPADQAIWDGIAAHRSAELGGPYGVLMNIPPLAARVAALEDYFRFDAELSEADRELVVLAAVREAGAHYAWARHEVRGNQVGVRPAAIEALRANGSLDGLTPREQLLAEIARSLLRTRTLSDALFARAMGELGQRQLIEVTTLVGHYGLVGLMLTGFKVAAPEGARTF